MELGVGGGGGGGGGNNSYQTQSTREKITLRTIKAKSTEPDEQDGT